VSTTTRLNHSNPLNSDVTFKQHLKGNKTWIYHPKTSFSYHNRHCALSIRSRYLAAQGHVIHVTRFLSYKATLWFGRSSWRPDAQRVDNKQQTNGRQLFISATTGNSVLYGYLYGTENISVEYPPPPPSIHHNTSLSEAGDGTRKLSTEALKCKRLDRIAEIQMGHIRFSDLLRRGARGGPRARGRTNTEDVRNMTQVERKFTRKCSLRWTSDTRGRWDPHTALWSPTTFAQTLIGNVPKAYFVFFFFLLLLRWEKHRQTYAQAEKDRKQRLEKEFA